MLEKVVEASGDGCVSGFVRFRRIKKCNGFKKAKNMAAYRLSKITGGRPVGNNQYAAVVRFRAIIFIFPVIAALIIFVTISNRTNAVERIVKEEETTVTIQETEAGDFNNMYIRVPGLTQCTVTKESPCIVVYNPKDNNCSMMYFFYNKDKLITQSAMLEAGEVMEVNLYNELSAGNYDINVITKSFSNDKDQEFNSVSQIMELLVY